MSVEGVAISASASVAYLLKINDALFDDFFSDADGLAQLAAILLTPVGIVTYGGFVARGLRLAGPNFN